MKTDEKPVNSIIRSVIVMGISILATRLVDKGLTELEKILRKRWKKLR